MNQQVQQQPTTSTRWAPWWVYFVIIVGANYLRRALLPDGGTPALRVVIALAVSAVLFAVITVIYRLDGPKARNVHDVDHGVARRDSAAAGRRRRCLVVPGRGQAMAAMTGGAVLTAGSFLTAGALKPLNVSQTPSENSQIAMGRAESRPAPETWS